MGEKILITIKRPQIPKGKSIQMIKTNEVDDINIKRVKKFKSVLTENDLDAFILFNKEYNNRPNVQYLSGFTGSYAILLINKKENYIITDSRYYIQAKEESDFTLLKQQEVKPWSLLKSIFKEQNISRLGCESDNLTVDKYNNLKQMGLSLFETEGLIMNLRSCKDEDELKLIKTACEIASEAFNKFYKKIKIGMTEAQLATELTYEMRKLGAEKPVKGHFVVASGKRGQRPHGVFSDKVIEDGDFVTIDFGAVYKGYVSDITRTIGIGNVSKKLLDIYDAVLKTQEKTIKKVSSKITGAQLDKYTRDLLEEEGYGSYFTHSTGHGIGLEIHELPMVNKTNKKLLPNNSVVTIEPGVYIPDLGGVRIEDDVVIKEEGCEVITSADKDLIVL